MKTELSKQQENTTNRNIIGNDKQQLLTGKQILSSINPKEEHKHTKQQITSQNQSIFNNKRTKRELKALIMQKENEISSLSHTQEKYQCELQSLLQKLNDIITLATNKLKNAKQQSQNPQKQIEYLEALRLNRMKDFQKAKSQNKIYKDQYDLYQTKANGISNDKLTELESKIDSIGEENQSLIKKVRELKNKQNVKSKVLEGYSSNVKYPREIKAYTEEIKSLSSKKHDYYLKLNTNRKAITNSLMQLTKIKELYSKLKTMTNLPNQIPTAKIESEINKLTTDLKGNEDDIIQRIDNDEMIIIQEDIKRQQQQQQQLQGLMANNNLLPHPKYLKSLIPLRNMKKNPHTSHSASRKIIIQNQDKDKERNKRLSPQSNKLMIPNTYSKRGTYSILNANINNTNNNTNINDANDNNNIEDKDFSHIAYDTLTDFEYRELITKKEHYYDIIVKLENSIKEAKKMYDRKLKEMNNTLDQSSKKLSYIEQENELLKSEITDLSKISKLNDEAYQLKKDDQRVINRPTIPKESIIPTSNNNYDVSDTRNDILNDLNELDNENDRNHIHNKPSSILEENDGLDDKEGNNKIKFPDISNVEHIDMDEVKDKGFVNREKVLVDIKKKYIKVQPKDEKEDKDDNEGEDNLNIKEKEAKQEEQFANDINKNDHSISIGEHSIDNNNRNDINREEIEKSLEKNNNEEVQIEQKKEEQLEQIDKKGQDMEKQIEEDNNKDLYEKNPNENNDFELIENNKDKNNADTQYPPKTIVRIQQREGKMNEAWKENFSSLTITPINPKQSNKEPLQDAFITKEVKVENSTCNHCVKQSPLKENITQSVQEKEDTPNDNINEHALTEKQNNKVDHSDDDEDIKKNALIQKLQYNDMELNKNFEDSIDKEEKEEECKLQDFDNTNEKEKEINQGKEDKKLREKDDISNKLNEDNKQDKDNDRIREAQKQTEENDQENEKDLEQGQEQGEGKEEGIKKEEQDENEGQEDGNQDEEEMDQGEEEEEEQIDNKSKELGSSKQKEDVTNNNPLSDSLEKNPQEEHNTIIDKLNNEKVYHE